jgi:hypothetical protein
MLPSNRCKHRSNAEEVPDIPVATEEPVIETLPDGSVEITISAVGDITIGGDVRKRNNIFENELRKAGRGQVVCDAQCPRPAVSRMI